jgi:ABC-type transport system substrate-binding protein
MPDPTGKRPTEPLHPHAAQGLILGLVLLLGGCRDAGAPPVYAPGPDAGGPPRRGGHAVFVREEDPDYIDPQLSYGIYTAPLVQGIFRSLLEYADAQGPDGVRLVPELAESLPDVREGGTLYCFKVRRDARFGAPLHRHIDAADFKYGFERQFRLGGPGIGFYLNVAGAQAMLDLKDTTVTGVVARGDSIYFRLLKPDPVFPQLLAMTFMAPVPREVDVRWPNAFTQHAVASGPFEVAEFVPRRRVLLVRNRDYCGEPALLDTFELRLGVTPNNAVAQVRRGLADGGMFTIPPGDYARLRRDPYWRYQIQVADGINTEMLFMNVRVKPFDDVRVRQAVNWALDRRAILKLHRGLGEPAGEFLPPSMPGAQRLGRYAGPDRERARRLLRDAGYPNGFRTRLYGWTVEPGPREMALIQQQLAEVGIRVDLDLGEAAGYTSMAGRTANRVPFGRYAWTADYLDPSNFFDVLLNGQRIQPLNNLDMSMFDDSLVNRWIAEAMASSDSSMRARTWRQIDERVMDLAPVAPLIHLYEDRLYSPRLGGWYRHVTRILKIDRLHLKAPRRAPHTAGRAA